jgi:Ca-activated chloride channel homolog
MIQTGTINMMIRSWIPVLMFMMIPIFSNGQSGVGSHVRKGNRAYERGDFTEAEQQYRKALGNKSGSLEGSYNLGGALYRQGRFPEAWDQYRALVNGNYDSLTLNKIWYNFGNASIQNHLKSQQEGMQNEVDYLSLGIEAYSEALRYNPKDADARYNLSRALQLKREQPQQQNKPREQQEQDRQKREQPLPESTMKEEENEQKAPPKHDNRINREDAERMLNAIREKEQKTAEQINERERRRVSTGKLNDW